MNALHLLRLLTVVSALHSGSFLLEFPLKLYSVTKYSSKNYFKTPPQLVYYFPAPDKVISWAASNSRLLLPHNSGD